VLDFALVLGADADERMGYSPQEQLAWFGTAFPLLAWERGRGWARQVAVDVAGETVTSEVFELRSLEVVAPSRHEVLGTGARVSQAPGRSAGTTVHRFSAEAVRDVKVAVGQFDVLDVDLGPTRLHLGVSSLRPPSADPQRWVAEIDRAVRRLEDLLGPFPYPDLWVTVLPSETSGIESAGAIQFADVSPRERRGLVTHEVAHMWLYGLVGNNQAVHPWLDESLSSLAQAVVDGVDPQDMTPERLPRAARDAVGRPMTYWAREERPSQLYLVGVYGQGGAALLRARRAVGEEAFDAALRAYVDANAHRIATPRDLEAAFADLPGVLRRLRDVGALPAVDTGDGATAG
jgi:hypothetical protein